jgi:hypothetical protein
MAGAAALTAIVDYLGSLDLTEYPTLYALIIQMVNLAFVAIKQKYFKK